MITRWIHSLWAFVRFLIDAVRREEIVVPTFWFLMIAGVCALAGQKVGSGDWIPRATWRYLVLYLLLLVPVFIHRQALYEAADIASLRQSGGFARVHQYIASIALFLPLVVLLLFVLIMRPQAFQLLDPRVLLRSAPAQDVGAPSLHLLATGTLTLFWGLLPLYAYATSITLRWPRESIETFRYRSMMPALMTIVMSFAVGWGVAQSPAAAALAAITISSWWLVLERVRPRNLGVVISGVGVLIVQAIILGIGLANRDRTGAWLVPLQVVLLSFADGRLHDRLRRMARGCQGVGAQQGGRSSLHRWGQYCDGNRAAGIPPDLRCPQFNNDRVCGLGDGRCLSPDERVVVGGAEWKTI
jgi:hypothetical protein